MAPALSIVVPVYNEEEVLPLFAQRLRPVADGLGTTYEVLTVDDGSTDLSPAVLQRIARDWPQLRIVRLRANAGHQAAISAGLASARGDYVVTLDADLQDPPEVISEMLPLALAEGADVVYGVRGDRSTDSAFKRLSARAFYRLIRTISGTRAEWEEWTGMVFPEDGNYVVPGALVPVHFKNGRGVYVEPNVWVRHAF